MFIIHLWFVRRGLSSSATGISSLGNTMPLGFPLQFGHLMQPNAIHGASANNVTLPGLASSMPSSTGESAGSAAETRLWDIPADTAAPSQARTVHDLESLNRAAREKEEQERLCAEREQAERLQLAQEQQQLAQEQQRRARELELEKAAELQRLQEEKRKQDEERQRLADERRKLEELRSLSL